MDSDIIIKAIMSSISRDNCPRIGLRVVSQGWEQHEMAEDGTLKPSRIWEDGTVTDGHCRGTSVVELPIDPSDYEYAEDDNERVALITDALDKIARPLSIYERGGDTILVVTYYDCMEGEDLCEVEAFAPTIIATIKL